MQFSSLLDLKVVNWIGSSLWLKTGRAKLERQFVIKRVSGEKLRVLVDCGASLNNQQK